MSQDNQKPATVEVPVPAEARIEVPVPAADKIEVSESASAKIEVPLPVSANVEDPATVVEPVVVTEKESTADVPAVPEVEEKPTEAAAGEETATAVVEDSNVAAELPEAQRKALEELKELVREALNKHEFTAPPPPPAKEEESKEKEEKKEDEKEEKKEEEKEDKAAATEVKPEDKPAASATVEAKPEVKAPAVPTSEVKPEEELPAAEGKKEEKLAAPPVTEAKKEEKPAAEVKTEEKQVPPPAVETKKEEKPKAAPAAETKAEEKPAASGTVTIENAFAADEDGAKTVEAIEESIVAVSSAADTAAPAAETALEPEEVSIWGIPLLQDDRSDVVLLKFLRAREFKVKEALTMLKNTICWRKEFKIDELLEEDLGNEFENIVFIHGVDKLNHPVCYNSYSEFQNKQLFADKETRAKFLRWRVQFHEKSVRALDFSPSAVSSFVNVSDFRNAPGLGKRSLWQFIKQAIKLFEDNYPEFVAKELLINVPWWYIPYYRTIGSLTSPRTTSKMVLSGPSKSADTIFKYVAPEQVPVKYGGLSNAGEQEFSIEDSVNEVILKPAAKHTLDLHASEGSTLVWELRVLASEVSYGAQFEPSTEGSYAVIVSKTRKIGLVDEPVITDSFKVGEPGKVVLTIDNQTSRKKKLLYRFKTKPRSE